MKSRLPILVLLACVAAFVLGVFWLFRLRFEAGDVYPPYSSLRADPLGTMALLESLDRLPGVRVSRDFSASGRLPAEPNTTYLHLAARTADWRWLPGKTFDEIETFLKRGGRLVITLQPETQFNFNFGTMPLTNAPGFESGRLVSVRQRWGVDFGYEDLDRSEDRVYEPVVVNNVSDQPLPDLLNWHSPVVLTNVGSAWRVIYRRGTNPVLVEREFGRGRVILATDSYFLSNEAMWKERQPDLLAWLVGAPEHVVFDEAHLGVVEEVGVATLLRRYRLHGVVGALVLLAGLFIWRNSTSLVPPPADAVSRRFVAGKDSAAGFVNLLRRNIAPRDILNVCFEEWEKSLRHRGNIRITAVDQAQAVMEAERQRPKNERDSVRAYRAISLALKASPSSHASLSSHPALRTPHLRTHHHEHRTPQRSPHASPARNR